jgi:hypothetical protein
MKSLRTVYLSGAILLGCLVLIRAQNPLPANCFNHNVKRGETVSLLCIQYYGYWSTQLGQAFKKLNPQLTDINVIDVGQKLVFANPVTKQSAKAPAAKAPVAQQAAAAAQPSLFERRTKATQGVVTCLVGTATLTPKGRSTSQPLTVNQQLYPGDKIVTGPAGRVEIIINRESVVRLDVNTRLTIEAFRDNETQQGKTRMDFSQGTVWAKIRNYRDLISRFELELPTAIAGVHGTVYQTTVQPDSTAQVKVFTGEVAVSNRPAQPQSSGAALSEISGPSEIAGPSEVSVEQWTQLVRNMQQLYIGKDGSHSLPQQFQKNPQSDWERWNEERDERIAEMFEGN